VKRKGGENRRATTEYSGEGERMSFGDRGNGTVKEGKT
jgi:hypothetical protein